MMRKWLYTIRSGRVSIPLVIGIGAVVLTGGLAVPAFLGALGVTAQMATSALFMAGAMLGTMLFAQKAKTGNMPSMASYPVQRSNKGTPIPKVYGTVRVAGNVLWMGPNEPWVKKTSSGGKGGGGGSQITDQGNRRSFLIGICEGPATVLRMWQGKTEISLSNATFFRGDGNTGIPALTGETYTNYPNLACVFFDSFEIGTSTALPNFTFEVGSGPGYLNLIVGGSVTSGDSYQATWLGRLGTVLIEKYYGSLSYSVRDIAIGPGGEVYVSLHISSATGSAIYKYDSEGNLDLTWGDGMWEAEGTHSTGKGASRLVINSAGEIYCHGSDGVNYFLQKVGTDGVTLWNRGIYRPYDLVFGSDGNIYAACKRRSSVIGVKYDSEGNVLQTYTGGTGDGLRIDVDSAGNVYIACGVSGGTVFISLTNANGFRWSKDLGMASCTGVVYLSGYVYVTGYTAADGDSVWKFDATTGAEVASYDVGSVAGDASAITRDDKGNLLVVGREGTNADGTYNVWKLDKDLNFVEGYLISDATLFACVQQPYEALVVDPATDVNPSDIIYDLLTNTRYGAGIDASEFIDTDSFDAVGAYCDENGLLFSFVIDAQKPILDWIDFINSHFQGYLFMTEGKIHLGIFKNESSTFTITQDNLVVQEGENPPPPVSIKKRAFSQTFNRIEIAWKNRAKDYDTSITIAMDEVDQRVSGKVRKNTIQLIGITNADLAQKMAYVMLFDSMYRFTIYNFTVSYKDMLIRVGDVGTLSDGGLIVSQKIRVTSIEEAKDGRGLVIEAVEDKNHIYETFSYTTEDSSRVSDPIPTLTNASATFTESLTEGGFAISIVPGGADTNGWHIYKSFDDATYELVGQANIAGVTDGDANSTGTIRSPLPAHATGPVYAGAEVVEVNIGTVTDLDTAITDDMFFNNQRLCKIGDEILAYKTCVETDVTGVWRITGLIRGLFGTEAVAHTVGDVFWTINIDFTFAFADSDIGKTIYFKILTFFENSIQSLADVSGISYVIQGKYKRPMPVSLMRIQNRGGLLTYETDDVVIAFYLASKTAGFNLGGFGDVLWDAYEPDLSIKTLDVTLKQTDDTEITNEVFDISEIGEPMALFIANADRGGNNPYIVEMNPGALYAGIGSREITVEKI